MLFSSIPFLFYFLPIVLVVYFVVPEKGKNLVLLGASLCFYAWGEPKYVWLMVGSILYGYVLGLLIEKHQGDHLSKIWLILSCILSIGFLGYFKYADFFIGNINTVTGLSIATLRIALPIGISFYTFQILSYTIDVYRGTTCAQRNLLDFATYVALFPQLIAGPIVRYTDIASQLKKRTSTLEKSCIGIRRFILGLSKKVLLANNLGALCDIFATSEEKTVVLYWIYGIAFMMQIYFDFSGYSDMAIGLGKIFGFDFLENFDYPYISKSVTEFWRRWHMSLGGWFRDYVYIPLGGNRVSRGRWFFNILVVWMLTGFWHGAAWNFILWGLMFAVLLVVEKVWLGELLDRMPEFLKHCYVLFFIMISFVLFNAGSLSEAFRQITGLFGIGGIPMWNVITGYYLRSYAVILLISMIACTPMLKRFARWVCNMEVGKQVLEVIEPMLLCICLLLVTAYLVDGSFNPFLYFRF